MSEPTALITKAAIESMLERLKRYQVAYHYTSASLSRRASYEEANRVAMTLEEAADRPVFFDRLDGNRFELWVEGPIL